MIVKALPPNWRQEGNQTHFLCWLCYLKVRSTYWHWLYEWIKIRTKQVFTPWRPLTAGEEGLGWHRLKHFSRAGKKKKIRESRAFFASAEWILCFALPRARAFVFIDKRNSFFAWISNLAKRSLYWVSTALFPSRPQKTITFTCETERWREKKREKVCFFPLHENVTPKREKAKTGPTEMGKLRKHQFCNLTVQWNVKNAFGQIHDVFQLYVLSLLIWSPGTVLQ